MTDPDNEQPDPKKPGKQETAEHEARTHELDIEADALLDSLLSDSDRPDQDRSSADTLAPAPEPPGFTDDEEITGVALPTSSADRAQQVPDEFSDVDELLTNSSLPPAAAAPQPTKSAKATLQGIKPAGIPRPFVQGPPRPPARQPSFPTGTRKPPPVNPPGPAIREPFLPAMSPKAPPAKVDRTEEDAGEEPTLREIVTESAEAPDRLSGFGLADELEPEEFNSIPPALSPEFEDLDEDILESVPPGPSEEDAEPSLPPEPASLPPEPASLPPEPASLPPESASLPPEPASLPPEPASLPPEPASLPPDVARASSEHAPWESDFSETFRPPPRGEIDTVIEDEHAELFDSLPDEALGVQGSELPAYEHLAEQGHLDAWRERAEWFEEQAHALADPAAKARALLIASEHFALVGDLTRARRLASETHAVQPAMAMGSRQLRWLAAVEQDYKAVAGALELETRASPTPLARAHAANLAADVHRVCFGDANNARRKLDLAARVLPTDPRPYLFRLAEQLGQNAGPPRLRWPDVEELAPLVRVAQDLERLRAPGKVAGEPASTYAITFEEARRALVAKEPALAIDALVRLSRARGMRRAALWLGAVLAAPSEQTRPRAIEMLRELADNEGSALARRALALRTLEQGDREGVRTALFDSGEPHTAFDAATRLILGALTGAAFPTLEADVAALAEGPLRPLAAAAEAASSESAAVPTTLTGDERQRDEIRMAHALALVLIGGARAWETSEDGEETGITALLGLREVCREFANKHGTRPLTQILGLEFALHRREAQLIAEVLSQWPGSETGPAKALASALVLEVSGDRDAAREQFKRALELDPQHEGATRALLEDAPPAQAAELLARLADTSDDPTQAGFLLLEAALLRTDDAKSAEEHLVQAATSAPDLPLVYLHGEHQARQRGDADLLLSWLRQRRENATDSIDKAFDFVREALLVAETDMELAASLLGDAVTARPNDVALRELHERLASHAGVERGKWRETVAAELGGEAEQQLLIEAALEYERAGDLASASRVARRAAEHDGGPFIRLTAERLDVARGNTAALSEALLKAARSEQDERTGRELYERLSELDELRGDRSSSLLWQSAILERSPQYLPALRRLEHEYISADRWDDLEPVALELSRQLDASEADARAIWVTEQRILSGRWEGARESIEIASKRERPSLWALRAYAGQARGTDDLEVSLRVELELMDRARSPLDVATLSLRAAEAATRLGKLEAARALLQRAIQQVPNHLVALTTLADVLDAMGAAHDAADALEAAATAYRAPKHQVELWHQAAVLWQDNVNNRERAIHALEAAVERDITHSESFQRLQSIYVAERATQKLADLLERRLASTEDPAERVAIEVMRGQALAGVGEKQAAKDALAAALDANPEHAGALDAFANLCIDDGDWVGAEQAWIRLARHVGDPTQQAEIYAKLGALYDNQLPNPTRAELAYQEVLKREPTNIAAMERLVDVHVALGDEAKAIELQQQLVERAENDEQRRDRTLVLARVYERLSQDPRQAMAVLEAAKKTYGNDSKVLRAHAEFLQRRGEDRSMLMLLDRAANEARRALSTGRFDTAFFETLSTVSELRGAVDGAVVAQATLKALRGEPTELKGAGSRAADPRLDELLAPPALSSPLRILLKKVGYVLDDAYPVDLRALRAAPLAHESRELDNLVQEVAEAFGVGTVEVYSSPALGPICMPVSSVPPRLVYGESLLKSDKETARYFLLVRALKLMQAGATSLSRTAPIDLWPLLAGLLNIFAANWEPQGADPRKTAQATGRIRAALSGQFDNDVPVLALEVIGSIGNRASQLGVASNQLGNRTGLLAVGDPGAAFEGIALAAGQEKGLPAGAAERLRWIVRSSEARDAAIFSVSDQYFQLRESLGVQAL